MGIHLIGESRPTVVIAVHLDIHAAIRVPLSTDMNLCANAPAATKALFVAAIGFVMPSCGSEAIAIVLSKVDLRTTPCCTRITIALDAAIRLVREGEVEVCVHVTMRIGQVHVELHPPVAQVERGFRTHPALTLDAPTRVRPIHFTRRSFYFFLEILCRIGTVLLGPARFWG